MITPFLMFNGQAKKALSFYTSLFEASLIKSISYFPGSKTKVQYAIFSLQGQDFMCIDSPVEHDFTFNPSFSIYVLCENEKQINKLYKALSRKGKVLMKFGPHGESKKFTWVEDRFGISWQLVLN